MAGLSTYTEDDLARLDVSRVERFAANAHWPLFARLRREAPVHYCRTSAFGPYWSITRLADVVAVEKAHRVFSSKGNIIIGDVPPEYDEPAFATFDPPEHTCDRLAAAPAVAPPRLARIEPEMRAAIAALLDGLPRGEPFDWAARVSQQITMHMVAALFDWPREDKARLPYWCEVLTATPAPGGIVADFAGREAILETFRTELMRAWCERARKGDGDDVLSLLACHPDTKPMAQDPKRVVGIVALIAGANEAARGALSGGVLAFHQFPEQWQRLRASHALIESAVSEIVRWQSPILHMRRTATEDIAFQGQLIRKGDKVVLWYCSANRDEAIFDNAGAFVIDRPQVRRHAGYGFGIHRCFGRYAAELELRILWEEILKRFARIEVVAPPSRFASNFAAGYESLMVRVHPL
jgi:cytochrome P450